MNTALPCRCKKPVSRGRAGITCRGFFPRFWGVLFFFFSGELCKAALDPARRLLAVGLKRSLGLRGLVGPSVALPAKGFC